MTSEETQGCIISPTIILLIPLKVPHGDVVTNTK